MSHCWAAAGAELIYAVRTEIISVVGAEKVKSGRRKLMGAILSRRSCGAHLSRWKMLIINCQVIKLYGKTSCFPRMTRRKVVDGEPCVLNVNKAVRVGRPRD
jgi:hypothetical protein